MARILRKKYMNLFEQEGPHDYLTTKVQDGYRYRQGSIYIGNFVLGDKYEKAKM